MKLSSKIILAFSIVLLLSIVDSYTNYLLSVKVKQNAEFLNKSEAIIRNSGRLHKAMIEMQSGFRGFLLTADSNFLDKYEEGLHTVPGLYIEQKELVKESGSQMLILDSIYQLHLEWIDYSDSLIDARKGLTVSGSVDQMYNRLFETRLKKMIGKKINDSITQKFLAFDKTEYSLRGIRGSKLIASIERTHTYSFIFLTLTVVIGIGSAAYIVLVISKRIKTMVNLAEDISKGKFTLVEDESNDELTRLSSALNSMSGKLSKTIGELEKRNMELDKFAYVVSHDLKAPVRGIHNVVQWIKEDLGEELSPQMKEYLNIIPQRTRRMEDLINGLLDYAKTREKRSPEEIDVQEMVKNIVEEIVPRNFQVEIYKLPVIYTERLKLEQVFTNLISNSVKYSHPGNGHLIIQCEELSKVYQFSVKDHGIGIDAEYHDKIFEIFQTLRDKNEKESTGIGLAIIKKIIEDQHGTIKVNSTSGKGAEFIFTWPRVKM